MLLFFYYPYNNRDKWNNSRGIPYLESEAWCEVRILFLILLSVFYVKPHVISFFGGFNAPSFGVFANSTDFG